MHAPAHFRVDDQAKGDRMSVLNGFAHTNDPSARQLAAEMSKKA